MVSKTALYLQDLHRNIRADALLSSIEQEREGRVIRRWLDDRKDDAVEFAREHPEELMYLASSAAVMLLGVLGSVAENRVRQERR